MTNTQTFPPPTDNNRKHFANILDLNLGWSHEYGRTALFDGSEVIGPLPIFDDMADDIVEIVDEIRCESAEPGGPTRVRIAIGIETGNIVYVSAIA